MEQFDGQVQRLVDTGKLSSSSIKAVAQLALDSMHNDAHMVSTLFRLHKKAKPTHKLYALYVIDAIVRECRSAIKKGKMKDAGKGTPAAFLHKMEVCLERIIDESWERGAPEHREKVLKVLGIWSSSATFQKELLDSLTRKLKNPGQSAQTPAVPANSSNGQPPPIDADSPRPPAIEPIVKDAQSANSNAAASALDSDLLAALTGGGKPKKEDKAPLPPEIASIVSRTSTNPLPPTSTPISSVVGTTPVAPPPPPAPAEGTPLVDSAAISLLLQQLTQGHSAAAAPPVAPAPAPSLPSTAYPAQQFDSRSPPQHYNRRPSPPRRFSPPRESEWNRPPPYEDEPHSFKRRRSRSPSPRRDRPAIPERGVEFSQQQSSEHGWNNRQQQRQSGGQRDFNAWAQERPAPKGIPRSFTQHPKPDFSERPPPRREQTYDRPPPRQDFSEEPPQPVSGLSMDGPSFFDSDKGFPDFTTFNPQDAFSWEKLGRTWIQMFGFVPSNEQLMPMCFMAQQMSNNVVAATLGAATQGISNDALSSWSNGQQQQHQENQDHARPNPGQQLGNEDDMDMDSGEDAPGPSGAFNR